MTPALVALVLAQGVLVKTGQISTTTQLTVNTQKAALDSRGPSTRASYIVTNAGRSTAGATQMMIGGSANGTVRIYGWCYANGPATSAAAVSLVISRAPQVPAAGTACSLEGVAVPASCSISKMDPADPQFPGIITFGAAPGTGGAVIDAVSFTCGELSAGGAADMPSTPPFCKWYSLGGSKPIIMYPGITQSVYFNLGAMGGLSDGTFTVYFTVDS